MPAGSGHHLEDIEHHNISSFFSNQLQDGFHEIFSFRGHRLQLRGLKIVDMIEDNHRRQGGFFYRQYFISWDVKQVLLWRQDFYDSQNEPQPHPILIQQVRFSNQPNFICAIIYIPRLKIFLAAALDMSFKLLDKTLALLESIRHEERAILQMEYDNSKDLIFTSGAAGISAWKIYRNTTLDKAHVMEKMYTFKGCEDWVTRMIYEPQFNRIYALKERSAQVLSIPRRSVVTVLEDCHEAPINVVCWYERNQFYITGCSRGEIKCWTSNYNHNEGRRSGLGSSKTSGQGMSDISGSSKVFALLHTFIGHSKAVTSIKLHPVSGLAISTGMDGFLKVLNLEALNELFSIKLDFGILSMEVVKMGIHGYGCLLTQADASIKLWKITSVCDFFATSSSKIGELQSFENLEAELEHFYKLKYSSSSATQQQLQQGNGGGGIPKEEIDHQAVPLALPTDSPILGEGSNLHHDDIIIHKEVEDDENEHHVEDDEQHPIEEDTSNKKDKVVAVEMKSHGGVNDRILTTFSTQDLRCFTNTGILLGRLEPEHIVDGIKAYTISVYQKMLFCLCERDRIRVHDLRRFTFPLLLEFSLEGGKVIPKAEDRLNNPSYQPIVEDEKTGQVREDMGTCCTLIDIAPTNAVRAFKASLGGTTPRRRRSSMTFAGLQQDGEMDPSSKIDARGQTVPEYIESYLLVGLNSGTILFLDTLNNFEVQMNFQANNGAIQAMKYRRRLRELLVLGKDFSESFSTVRIWRLPDLELIAEVSDLRRVSCFSISLSLSHFAVGTAVGNVRLFNVDRMEKTIKEMGRVSDNHDGAVNSICFCDDIRVFCSSSQDCRVKFWDLGKRLVRTIHLNTPTCGVVQNGGPGDVLMAQNHYLLTIPLRIWNEGDLLGDLKKQIENTAAELNLMSLAVASSESMNDGDSADLSAINTATTATGQGESYLGTADGTTAVEEGKTSSIQQDNTDEKSVTSSRRNSRRNSRRMSRGLSNSLNNSIDKRDETLARKDKRRSSFQSISVPMTSGVPSAPDPDAANREAAELEEKVLLPQLEARQFEFVKVRSRSPSPSPPPRSPSPSPPVDEVDPLIQTDSVYSRMQQFSQSLGENSLDDQRHSEPFVYDVLHPKFLLHKKPSARPIQLEDLEKNFSSYLSRFNAIKANVGKTTSLFPALGAQQGSIKPTQSILMESNINDMKRPVSFGLSPRARLTLLSSQPVEISPPPQLIGNGNGTGDSDKAFNEAVQNAINSAHASKTQESVIYNAAINMKVSDSYRKHRENLKTARNQRIENLTKFSSVTLDELKRKWNNSKTQPQVIMESENETFTLTDDDDERSESTCLTGIERSSLSKSKDEQADKSVSQHSSYENLVESNAPIPPTTSKPSQDNLRRRISIKP